jgi:hypothetical protein
MHDILTKPWRISEDAVANSVGGEMVILHLGNGNYYGLDAIGTLLWDGLKSGKLPIEVCDEILEHYEVEREAVETDIAQFLVELQQHELVEAG